MAKYLYGASVQGIQSFIFQTNKLKEIAGASELVENICTELFRIEIGSQSLEEDPNAMLNAAGNIRYIFEDKDRCKNLVKEFPRKVMEFAPGITISQAVVKFEGNMQEKHIKEIEELLRTQRSKPFRPLELGLQAAIRSRSTGFPAVKAKNETEGEERIEYYDKGTVAKIDAISNEENPKKKYGRLVDAFFGDNSILDLPLNLEEMSKTRGDGYAWLAIIHADGNNMGVLLQKLAEEMSKKNEGYNAKAFKAFSMALQQSTESAARMAYESFLKKLEKEQDDYIKQGFEKRNGFHYKAPFRPIIIGGDDITVICRADLALDFTNKFLSEFEKQTRENMQGLGYECLKQGLTACAGISFVKYSFPFHFGYDLAEDLCQQAKNVAKTPPKDRTPSCLMFHKVQDSFVTGFDEIKRRDLIAKASKIRFDFGPYFINSKVAGGYPCVATLQERVRALEGKEGNAIKSHLRQWLTDLHRDKDLASQKMKRLLSTGNREKLQELNINVENGLIVERKVKEGGQEKPHYCTPVYDWLSVYSINEGGTEL